MGQILNWAVTYKGISGHKVLWWREIQICSPILCGTAISQKRYQQKARVRSLLHGIAIASYHADDIKYSHACIVLLLAALLETCTKKEEPQKSSQIE